MWVPVLKEKKMKWSWGIPILLLLVAVLPAGAQSNPVLDEILELEALRAGEGAWLVLAAAGKVDDQAGPEEAFRLLGEAGWALKAAGAEAPIRLGDYAYLLMQAFDLQGGLMYRILPGPRYAARELFFLRLIVEDGSPYRALSGREAVHLLGRVLELGEVGS
jgi:hypothetical protein